MDSDPSRWAAWTLTDARPLELDPSGLATHLTSPALRPTLQPGDRVGVVFLFRGRDHHGPFLQNELVWLTVCAQCEDAFLATLDEQPSHSNQLRAGDCVAFEPMNIAAFPRSPALLRHRPPARPRLSSWRWPSWLRLLRLGP